MTVITLAQALSTGHGRERKFTCPVHQDANPSASVNVAKGVWFCYRCHAHGTVSGAVFDDVAAETVVDSVRDTLADAGRVYPESWLDQYDAGGSSPYWLDRFEPQTVSWFRLGYDAVKDAATYPLRSPAGEVLGVVRRDLTGRRAKYRYPVGVRTTELLFNFAPLAAPRIVLVEGATDAMAAWEVGAVAFATFSNLLSRAQLRLLERVDPAQVVIAYDADEAGEAGAEAAARLLGGRAQVFRARFPHRRKDLAECSPSERREALQQAIAL